MDLSASISERLGLQCKAGFVHSVRVVRKELEKKPPKYVRRCLPPVAAEKRDQALCTSSGSGLFYSTSALQGRGAGGNSAALVGKQMLPSLKGLTVLEPLEKMVSKTVLLKAVDPHGFASWVPHRLVEVSAEQHIKFDVKCTFGARLGPSFLSSSGASPSPSPSLVEPSENESSERKRDKRNQLHPLAGGLAAKLQPSVDQHVCAGHACKQCMSVTDQLEKFERRLEKFEEERRQAAALPVAEY